MEVINDVSGERVSKNGNEQPFYLPHIFSVFSLVIWAKVWQGPVPYLKAIYSLIVPGRARGALFHNSFTFINDLSICDAARCFTRLFSNTNPIKNFMKDKAGNTRSGMNEEREG